MVSKTMYGLGSARSCIRELFEYGLMRASQVGAENVYDYSLGNPSIPAPEKVNESIIDIISNIDSLAVHGYTPASGAPDARDSIVKDLNDRFGAGARRDNIFFSCGAAPALISIIKALIIDHFSEIIIIAPFFPEYKPFIEANGARAVIVSADYDSFQINLDELSEKINENTQAIIINSPNNPCGVVYSEDTLKKLSDILSEKSQKYGHPIYIIADEPYRELVYDGIKVPFIPTIYNNTIVSYSYSKSLSLPGERIGYVYVPDSATDSSEVFAAIAGAARIIGHVCAPSLMQKVVARCIGTNPDLENYDRNRRRLYDELTSYGYQCVYPQGAFYLFIKAPGLDATAFSEKAKQKDLLLVPGKDFGCPEYFRICTCVSADMIERSLPIFKQLLDM